MCIALSQCPLECIVETDGKNGLKPATELRAVHYKELEDRQTQRGRHMKVEIYMPRESCPIREKRSKLTLRFMHFETSSLE